MKSLRVLLILAVVTAFSSRAVAQEPATPEAAPESAPEAAPEENDTQNAGEEVSGEVVVETTPALAPAAATASAEAEKVAEEVEEEAEEDVVEAAPEVVEEGTELVEQEELMGPESDYILLRQVDTATRLVFGSFFADRPIAEVTQKQIEIKQAESITDALADQPGVFIQSTNPGAGSVIIRGAVGPENMFVFDGVRYNQSTYRTGPNQYLNLIDPIGLGSIRLLRGPAGVHYGGGSIGGAVFMTPQYLERAPLYQVQAGFRSADLSYHLAGETTFGADEKKYLFQVGADVDSHNDLRVGSNAGGAFNIYGAPPISNLDDNNRVIPSGYTTYHWRARGQAKLTDQIKLRLDYFGGFTKDAPRTDRIGKGEIRFYSNVENLLYATMEYDGEGLFDQIRFNLSYHRADEDVYRVTCKPSGSPLYCARLQPISTRKDDTPIDKRRINIDSTDTLGTSLSWLSSFPEYALSLQYGLDGYFDFVGSKELRSNSAISEYKESSRGNFADGSRYVVSGLYLMGDWDAFTFGDSVLNLRVGARGEITYAYAPPIKGVFDEKVQYTNVGAVGSASLNYFYSDLAHVYLTWAEGFRPPNLHETTFFGDAGSFYDVPNPDLKPERSDTIELGGKLFFPDLIRVNTNLFVSLLSDRISPEPNTTYNGSDKFEGRLNYRKNINAENAYYYGAELDFETASFYYTNLFGNVTWYDGAVSTKKEDKKFLKGPLHGLLQRGSSYYTNPRRLPPLRWNLGATFSMDESWFVSLWGEGAMAQPKISNGDRKDLRICNAQSPSGKVYHGKVYRDFTDGSCPGSPAWATLNVRGGYKYKNFFINAALENILDTKYRPHGSGYAAPGINFMTTVGYRAF